MPRIARLIAPGYPHHIVQRGNNREAVFFSRKDRERYLHLLSEAKKEYPCTVHAYCLMTNHIHLLITPNEANTLAKIMQKISLCYTQYVNSAYRRTGRLWECRFHSTIIDSNEYFWIVCRYIERNPVRAKIVQKPAVYQWSSAHIHSRQGNNALVEKLWDERKRQKEYVDFIDREEPADKLQSIRKALYSGKPLGGKAFLNDLQKYFGITVNLRAKGRPKKIK